MNKLVLSLLSVLFVNTAMAKAEARSTECAKVAKKAAIAVFNVSAKQTPKDLQFISATVKAEELTEEPVGRYSALQYRVDVVTRNASGHVGGFYYRVETRGPDYKKEKCFVEAVVYNHDD